MASRHPWPSDIRVSPSGLRDCVLRAEFMSGSELRMFAKAQKASLMREVAKWRLEDYERWVDLLVAMGIEGSLMKKASLVSKDYLTNLIPRNRRFS